ncbi:ER-golgi trafficking TRAPP I complex 85 kDa subunit-domain-containing protein [Irpex rosettiformis]|uniref:ER-golgi trafficking TRAPP I complex 85 kDa subunit-domain-containing protein n=1 Tax=Irpex rosettiformis TaxID=378272 RepID=A0ACB8UKU7_9APHY|nr:ER-golgi trafficking TRAPP I complex 85 kDa subunit-domain-containing protein [Irpex rosettiformis]
MAPSLPFSLSPHICVHSSPDLLDLLDHASLPPLPRILQAFVPLSQVTTRTTTLTSVPHASFALRFSDLTEVESSVHEDEEQRAGRTLDWIGSRIATQSARWVEAVESSSTRPDDPWRNRTPWWDEVKRCIQGDNVPNRVEGWNHPVSIICAVSTLAANPLQALQEMHARPPDFPPWVDSTHLRYSLIVHPSNSPLSDSIAESLVNAVKKQYGLHTYLLSISLAEIPLQQARPIASPVPCLPSLTTMELSPIPTPHIPAGIATMLPRPTTPKTATLTPNVPGTPNLPVQPNTPQKPPPSPGIPRTDALALSDNDIQQISRFVREFVVMSVVPWMEKCVMEWNESYSSSRRLPSRLFSSTRRLFGTGYSSAPSSSPSTPPTGHGSNPSVSSVTSRFAHGVNNSVSSLASITSIGSGSTAAATIGTVSQQRRLAEFATVLGDYKLAITVWETLRKDSKGGSDILPLLVAPSPALALHASNSINALHTVAAELPAWAQLRALVYAVRWDIGIDPRELIGNVLEGDRWLVQASGAAEEPPTALLLGHAAFLSSKKGARRRSALWYLHAADRLEKAGIKPIALYFFRQAHRMYKTPATRWNELSPSFWESEGKDPADWRGFEAVLPGIEHELGRLLYTTNDTVNAVRYFLGLLRGTSVSEPTPPSGLGLTPNSTSMDGTVPPTDRVYLEDFRVALRHFRTNEGAQWEAAKESLQLNIKLCQVKESRLRLPGDAVIGELDSWKRLEESWQEFWRPRGPERLEQGGKAAVNEPFWFDLVLRNPLNVEISMSRLSLIVREATTSDDEAGPDFLEVETLDDITLGVKETRTIPISIKCSKPASLVVVDATYEFLSLLQVKESLAIRGRRLHDTPQQRQNKVYAPDILTKIEVEDAGLRLQAHFVDDRHLMLIHGERKHMNVTLLNTGNRPIGELWLLTGPYDAVWVNTETSCSSSGSEDSVNILRSTNSFASSEPFHIPLDEEIAPQSSLQLSMIMHAAHILEHDLSLLLVFRDSAGQAFHSARLTRHYEVKQTLQVSTSYEPSQSATKSYLVNIDLENTASTGEIYVSQIMTLSPSWSCEPISQYLPEKLSPRQLSRVMLAAHPLSRAGEAQEVRRFLESQLRSILQGTPVEPISPPVINLECNHIYQSSDSFSPNDPVTRHFIHTGRCSSAARAAALAHPHIPAHHYPHIFPLYEPSAIDFVFFWEIPSQSRSGHLLVTGLSLGASHAPLRELVEETENAKAARSMYAETQRERSEVLEAVRNSEWNTESDPLVMTVEDGLIVEHDFKQGPCSVPVRFTMRNQSLTHNVHYTLRLLNSDTSRSEQLLHAPQYVGRLTHKGELQPSQSAVVSAKLSARTSGGYGLDSWKVVIDVLEPQKDNSQPRVVRQRYERTPQAGNNASVTIVDKSST